MAEPEINGEIAFSEILDGIPEETFIVDSILEPLCDADFCEDFNDYAFQKLPTFRDNFNYSTQASADANWISSDLPQIRVNAQTEVIDYDWTQSNAIEAISFDLGADTVNKEKWALRFKFVLNSFTKADASPNLPFIGLATANSSTSTVDGDGIGFQVEVRTAEPVDFNLQHRDGATGNNDLVGNIGDASVLIDVSTGTFYVELRRESSTKAVCDVYSDAQFTTLLGTGEITMEDLTSDLRYILIVGRDNNGMNLLDGTIEDLEFWNAGQQGDITFQDNFKQKTITFEDDFSSYADQTEADASWAIVGTTIRVNPSTDVMDWDFDKVGGNRASAFDLGAGFVNDTKWTLRWKQTYDTVGDTSSSANIGNIGLYDSDETRASSQTQDFVTFKFFKGTNTTTTNFIGLQSGDGIILNDGAGDSSFATQKNPIATTTLYFELKRTSATTYEGNIYSDATYTTLVDTLQETVSATATGLRYIKIQNDDRIAIGGGSFNGTMDDIQFWNGDSTLIRWLGATGNDVRLDIINKRINFDIPNSSTDNAISHDLQSSIGVNASDENWTLRFKTNIITFTDNTNSTGQNLFVSVSDSDDSVTADTTQDAISFRLVNKDSGDRYQLTYSDGEILFANLTNFTRLLQVETVYVELKRESPTQARAIMYSDANYTTILETVNVTIPSTITGLRYIKIQVFEDDGLSNGSLDGSIDDIEFYNGVSVSKTPVFETKDDDDTFITDNYTNISGTKVGVNTTTQVIDWTSSVAVLYNEGEFNDVFGGVIDTSDWALRFKLDVTASSLGVDGTANSLFVGFSDDNTGTPEAVQDYVGLQIFRQATGNTGTFRLMGADGTAPNLTAGTDTTLIPTVGTYYIEIRRIGTTISLRIYSDPDFTQLLESISEALEVGVTGLRYLKVLVSNRDGSGDHTFDGTIDDMQFWNQQNALDHENKWMKVDE